MCRSAGMGRPPGARTAVRVRPTEGRAPASGCSHRSTRECLRYWLPASPHSCSQSQSGRTQPHPCCDTQSAGRYSCSNSFAGPPTSPQVPRAPRSCPCTSARSPRSPSSSTPASRIIAGRATSSTRWLVGRAGHRPLPRLGQPSHPQHLHLAELHHPRPDPRLRAHAHRRRRPGSRRREPVAGGRHHHRRRPPRPSHQPGMGHQLLVPQRRRARFTAGGDPVRRRAVPCPRC